jgi:hypothetical protein
MFAEVGLLTSAPPATQFIFSFNDTTASNRWSLGHAGDNTSRMFRNTGGAGLVQTSTANTASVPGVNRIAMAIGSGASISLNGGTVATTASYAAPTVTKLDIGNQLSANYLNGHIRRLTYWTPRLPGSTLQRITQ